MPKLFADGSKPVNNQTFVLECTNSSTQTWEDVTLKYLTRDADPTFHFHPRRSEPVIQVAEWKKFARQDARGEACDYGARVLDMVWKDGQFEQRLPDGAELKD